MGRRSDVEDRAELGDGSDVGSGMDEPVGGTFDVGLLDGGCSEVVVTAHCSIGMHVEFMSPRSERT